MTKIAQKDFVFKKHMIIGEADAENDKKFLAECFVDTGDYEVLIDTDANQSIVLGRTGAGKSALLEQIEINNERVIRIEPEELALRYVSNSTILTFFEELGVNLDIFYNLLWQHTLSVELIRHKYSINSPQAKTSFIDAIKSRISGDYKKQQALKYIEEWGDKFWIDTESRIKEFTDKLEANLQSSIKTNIPGINITSGAAANLTEEQKTEVLYYGKKVVSQVQIKNLSRIVTLLSEDIFTDPQQKVYVLIDRLDENWVEDDLRYKLIRALIETVRKFRNIRPVKIILTLRTDLLERVLDKTRDSGFQREKYNTFFLEVEWSKLQLKEILDKRINYLLKHKYTSSNVFFDDVFPSKIDKVSSADYILDRTLLRPRDAIMFVNACFREAQGKTGITNSIIKLGEKNYSLDRLDSLKYEWFVEHPCLDKYIDLLHDSRYHFKISDISVERAEALVLELSDESNGCNDIASSSAKNYLKSNYPNADSFMNEFIQNTLYILYKVGVVGIKVDGTSSVRWISDRTHDLTAKKIGKNSMVYVHKILWRSLAIDKR